MKYGNFDAFQKHVTGSTPNHFAPVYLVMVHDDYDRKQATSLLEKGIGESVEEMVHLRGDKNGEELLQELASLSLFSKERAFVLYRPEKFTKKVEERLIETIQNLPKGVFLLFVSAAVHRGSKFYKNVEKIGVVLDIPEEKPWQKEQSVIQKLQAAVQSQGKSIDHAACRLLVQQLGLDQELLFNELEKLLCYAADRPKVTVQDIQALSPHLSQETVWELGSAIFRRDSQAALAISTGLIQDDGVLLALLRQLRYQFHTQFNLCTMLNAGQGEGEVQKMYPYMRGNILKKNIASAREYGLERFRSGLIEIDKAEFSAKNSGASVSTIADRLIMELTRCH